MAGQRRVTVTPKTQGGWKVAGVRDGVTHRTQETATNAARGALKRTGGGELQIKGRDGKIREQNTIERPDPRGSKG